MRNIFKFFLILLISCENGDGEMEKYPDGRLKTEFNLKDGLVRGYYPSGNIQYEADFKMGVQDGKTVLYHENGNIQKEMYFSNGVQQDTMKAYFENGNLQEVSVLKSGSKQVKYLEYRVDGLLKLEGQLEKGRPVGEFKLYSQNTDKKVIGILNYNTEGEMMDALSMLSGDSKEYASSFLEFEMVIPKSWEIAAQESNYVLFRPKGSKDFTGTVNVVKTRYENTSFEETVDLDVKKMKETMTKFKLLNKESSKGQGYKITYTAEINGIPIKSLVMYIDKGNNECYLITCISKQELFKQYAAETFKDILASFKFDNYERVIGALQAYLN